MTEHTSQLESERVEPGYIVLIQKALALLPDSTEKRNARFSMAILEATVAENIELQRRVESLEGVLGAAEKYFRASDSVKTVLYKQYEEEKARHAREHPGGE